MDKKSRIADFIEQRSAALGKNREQLAKQAGFKSSAALGRVLTGRASLQLSAIVPLAKALRTDPQDLLRHWIADADPNTAMELEPVFDRMVSDAEWALIQRVREAGGMPFLAPMTRRQSDAFGMLLNTFDSSASHPSPIH